MARTVAGTLRRADGTPLTAASLIFRAERLLPFGAPDAPPAEVVAVVNGAGEYSVALTDGRYSEALRWSSFESPVGKVHVKPGPTISLPALLLEPA